MKKPYVNVIILGNAHVGKTALLNRYSNGKYQDFASSIGLDLLTKDFEYCNQSYKIKMWDTAGAE